MKIAFFSDCYLDLTGGIVGSIDAQKEALEALGHTVYVFSTGFPKSQEELQKLAQQNIFVVPSCRLFFRWLTPVARRPRIIEKWLMREHPELRDFDVFYVHYEAGCSIAALRLARELGIPSVQVMHGREDKGEASILPLGFKTIGAWFLNGTHSWYLPHPRKVARDNYLAKTIAATKMWELMVNHANAADLVISPSKHFLKKLQHYGVSQPAEVAPNGYPDAKFLPKAQVKELKAGEPLKIIWHSRLSKEKRIMEFLEALTKVRGKYHLKVYGDGADFERAKIFAQKNKLKVDFLGNKGFEVVQKAILDAHLDVLTSYDFDDYPMTLVEAEAVGVPVFFCDPDMCEVVPPGSYLLSVDETPMQMAETLNELLAHPEKIRKMSEIMIKNREEVLISRRIKKIEKIFEDITKK